MKILIVEDDQTNIKILLKFLEGFGLLEVACNGKLGFQAYEISMKNNQPYDLILLDILMPEMDGHECLSAIRSYEKENGVLPGNEVKVIIISALGDQKNVCTAFFNGNAECYLTKPVDRKQLIEAVKSLQGEG